MSYNRTNVKLGDIMNKNDYIQKVTEVVALKSTCYHHNTHRAVGAVFINDEYEIIATGYNSSPKNIPKCRDVGCLEKYGSCVRTVHAEMNAVLQAAKRGTALKNSILYVTRMPCFACAKHLINLSIKEVRYRDDYKNTKGKEWLEKVKIKVQRWKKNEFRQVCFRSVKRV
jgi:dCMP deaminase